MCRDLDLFGQVIVTVSDVELWLENSRFTYDNNPNRFYKLDMPRKDFDQNIIMSALMKYVEPPEPTTATGCPTHWHRCNNPACPTYQKNKKRDYNRMHSAKKKADRAAWLESCKLIAA